MQATRNELVPMQVEPRMIGQLLSMRTTLNEARIQKVLEHQQKRGLLFGQSAIALRYATQDDVIWALSQQYQYTGSGPVSDLHDELVAAIDPFGTDAEQFRLLRSRLQTGPLDEAVTQRVLAIVSPQRGDGKTYLAANLAVSLSQTGADTLLLDADLRTGRAGDLFDVDTRMGLSMVLSGRARLSSAIQGTSLPRLGVLTAGPPPPNPIELLQGPAFKAILSKMAEDFQYVIVDTPAFAHGADAQVIARRSAAALIIARRNRSTMGSLQALREAMDSARVPIAGLMLNEH